jgi:tetratricopeptide (TPR) repeat protein
VSEEKKKKRKKSPADLQRELREIVKPSEEAAKRPPIDWKKIGIRIALIVAVGWVIALFIPGWVPKAVAGGATLAVMVGVLWLVRYVKKGQAIGALLQDADTKEARAAAIEKLETDFKKGDAQAAIAKAQLQMQEDPRAALETLESINLDKQMAPVAGQVRALRAMLHLQLGEVNDARALVDKLDLGKQQEPKTRATFATVAAEAWARSGEAQKALDTLDLFNPEDEANAELRVQMWRARAFACAAKTDIKGVQRALKKLADVNPHLLGMFLTGKKIHPLLEREAKQLVMKAGAFQRKVMRQRM